MLFSLSILMFDNEKYSTFDFSPSSGSYSLLHSIVTVSEIPETPPL